MTKELIISKERLQELADEGYNSTQIAKITGVARSTIYRMAKLYNVKVKKERQDYCKEGKWDAVPSGIPLNPPDEAIKKLACAIINLAVSDAKELNRIKAQTGKTAITKSDLIISDRTVEMFFKSEDYEMLAFLACSEVSGKTILERLKKDAVEQQKKAMRQHAKVIR
jgi:transcriptional regulator with GAF, ATPase, and Fis domain